LECYRLIREILDALPPGDLTGHVPRRIKAGETIARVEAPRGELFYFVKSNGSDTPERVKVRTPTICNMASVIKLAIGHQLADVPMILAGIDPCFSCNDRVAIVDRGGRRSGPGRRSNNVGPSIMAAVQSLPYSTEPSVVYDGD
jgi:NADH-quinone oxidoreductase subunit D